MDKAGRDTGPGVVLEKVTGSQNTVVIADLINYNFDGNLLKDEHKQWIDFKLVPLLRQFALHVKLTGTASRKGDREYNQQLSVERVLRVKKYLIAKDFKEDQVPGEEMKAFGEDLSEPDRAEDDPRDRAVRITVAVGRKFRPIFPTIVIPIEIGPEIRIGTTIKLPRLRKIPSPRPGSKDWKIKQLSEGDVGLFRLIGFTGMFFEIVDTTNNVEIICVAPGVGTGLGTPASLTLEGPFNRFSTSNPHHISEFEGPIEWVSLYTAATQSYNRLIIDDLGVNTQVETGITIGASVLSTSKLNLFCSDPRPYFGP